MKGQTHEHPSGKHSAWDPLRPSLFRSLWLAAVASNIDKIRHLNIAPPDSGEFAEYRDTSDPSKHIETFVVESWVEHLRQHERVTISDRSMQARVNAFHIGQERPIVSHFIHVGKK